MALVSCPECGKENVSSSAVSCPNCGFGVKEYYLRLDAEKTAAEAEKRNQYSNFNSGGNAFCPNCGSNSISRQVFQENRGSNTISHTNSKYKEQGHGCMWWLLIGWWWWIIDLCLWICFFIPRLILRLFAAPFKKKKYKGRSTSVSKTVNDISYRTICVCNKCGHTWS